MYRLLYLAVRNLKKKKSDAAILACLILLATFLLYLSISALMNMERIQDRAYEAANTSDYVYFSTGSDVEKKTEILSGQPEVRAFEVSPCLYLLGVKYHTEKDPEEQDYSFCLSALEEDREINKMVLRDQIPQKENSIVLPYYFKSSLHCKAGETITMTVGSQTYRMEIMGFTEDPIFATPSNVSIFRCYIPQAHLDRFLKNDPGLSSSLYQEYKVKLKEGESTKAFENKVSIQLKKEITEEEGSRTMAMNWESMKAGVGIMANIFMSIMLVFAVLLILVTLIIIRFHVRNFIEDNLKNIGILQASGYRSGQLRACTVLEMLVVVLGGGSLGLLLGWALEGSFGRLQASMLGLNWELGFDTVAALIALASVTAVTLIITAVTSRIYRRVAVLEALRGGICAHNFKRNHLRLDQTHLGLTAALSGKVILGEKMKNLSLFLIAALLSLTSCIGFAMYQNFALDSERLMELTGLEVGTALVTGEGLAEKGRDMESWDVITKIMYQGTMDITVRSGSGQIEVSCDAWQEPERLEHDMLVEGRFPEYDNEIVLTTLCAKQLGVKSGDMVSVEGAKGANSYLVSGIDQKINNMGLKAMMNFEGAARLNGTAVPGALYVTAAEGYSYDELAKKIQDAYPNLDLVDNVKLTKAPLKSIASVMEMVCIVFVTLTCAVIVLVVFLIVKSRVVREKKNFGIYKAMGFTTRQLVWQTILSCFPVISAGAMAGAAASIFVTEPLVVLGFAFCGIQKCNLAINPVWQILTVSGISAVAFLVALICAVRLRRLDPGGMLKED